MCKWESSGGGGREGEQSFTAQLGGSQAPTAGGVGSRKTGVCASLKGPVTLSSRSGMCLSDVDLPSFQEKLEIHNC